MVMRNWGGPAAAGILLVLACAAAPAGAAERTFTAKLEPNRNILPGEIKARGTAAFRLSADGKTLSYKVDAFGIDGISAIHIHFGPDVSSIERGHHHLPPGDSDHGATVVSLLKFTRDGLPGNGTVAQGTLTAKNLSGPARRQGMSYLAEHMEKGYSYVNIHVFHDFGQGRKFCCPSVLLGVIWPDE